MSANLLTDTIALRAKALSALTASPAYRAFKALDDAVNAMGGDRLTGAIPDATAAPSPLNAAADPIVSGKRITQGDVSEKTLNEVGRPLHIQDLLNSLIKQGAATPSERALPNFRSTLSRDQRFVSLRHEGVYYWWLKDKALHEGWDEAEPNELPGLNGSAPSFSSSQEGGDGHGPATT